PETRPDGGVIPLKGRDKSDTKPETKNKGKPNWSKDGGKKSVPKNRARPKPVNEKQGSTNPKAKKVKSDRPKKEKTNAPRGKNAVLKRRK
ncbi:ATP-dependent RNA helicase, partial [Amylibacter sp.]|nr:ATP-dependent RNA helicase [Amylibacter sp.]